MTETENHIVLIEEPPSKISLSIYIVKYLKIIPGHLCLYSIVDGSKSVELRGEMERATKVVSQSQTGHVARDFHIKKRRK